MKLHYYMGDAVSYMPSIIILCIILHKHVAVAFLDSTFHTSLCGIEMRVASIMQKDTQKLKNVGTGGGVSIYIYIYIHIHICIHIYT